MPKLYWKLFSVQRNYTENNFQHKKAISAQRQNGKDTLRAHCDWNYDIDFDMSSYLLQKLQLLAETESSKTPYSALVPLPSLVAAMTAKVHCYLESGAAN